MPPGQGNWRRRSLREMFLDLLRRAASWPADAVLIGGDLFELGRVSRETIGFLKEAFELVRPIPVFIAPGNEDPFMPGSPYAVEPWPSNVFIFERNEWTAVALEDVPLTVHGVACEGDGGGPNVFGSLTAPSDGRVHVALAHGSERSLLPPDKAPVAPFDISQVPAAGLAYLALGHFHAMTEVSGAADLSAWYSGTPEGHGFHEPGPHHYLEVEIESNPTAPYKVRVTPASVSRTMYTVHEIDCTGMSQRDEVVNALCALRGDFTGDVVARVTLTGLCVPALKEQFLAIQESLGDTFTFLDLLDQTEPAEDYAELAREHTSLGLFIRRLTAEIGDTVDERRRRMLQRAREVGLAAYRDSDVALRSVEGNPR